MGAAPIVSVVMPCYNAGPWVGAAVASILGQGLRDLELIVVDDASTDDSAAILAGVADPRLVLVRHARNQGIVATRNAAVAAARGAFLAILDADDLALPGRLAAQVGHLQRHPEQVLVGSWVETIEADGSGRRWLLDTDGERLAIRLLFANPFVQSSVTLRRSALPIDGPYRAEFPLAQDYDLWARLLRRGPATNLPRVLVRYRRHAAGVTATRGAEQEQAARQVVRTELERFGLRPDDGQLDLHRAIARRLRLAPAALTRAEDWLLALAEHNEQVRHYDRRRFRHVLGELWFWLCAAHAGVLTSSPGQPGGAPSVAEAYPGLAPQERRWLRSRWRRSPLAAWADLVPWRRRLRFMLATAGRPIRLRGRHG